MQGYNFVWTGHLLEATSRDHEESFRQFVIVKGNGNGPSLVM